MSHETTPGRRRGLESPPSEVEITIVADPAARSLRLARLALVIAMALAVLGAVLLSARDGGTLRPGPTARDFGAAGVAAAYGFPPRCLVVTILGGDRTYARVDFNRASACGRYDWTTTAIFHRIGGVWRPALVAASYSCPVRSLPRAVQVRLDVCE